MLPRTAFWEKTINERVARIPVSEGNPVYIATGGGYGSFDGLLDYFKQNQPKSVKLPANVEALCGDEFRNLPEFEAEKAKVRTAIAEFLAKKENRNVAPDDKKVEEVLRSFYSDEVNTKLAKEAIMEAIIAKKSVAHISASIYNDTEQRAELAKENGVPSILIAGDNNLNEAIARQTGKAGALATAQSHQRFSTRFQEEWVDKFD